ncbi:MAG: D-alanyl-D-alanine carboxypeptidase, partial [Atribacterota bacterium]
KTNRKNLASFRGLLKPPAMRVVVYFSSSISGEIEGDLFIKGSGDPTQSPEVIREIANKLLKKYSIHQISGDIVLDDFFSPEEFLGRGWMWDDENPLISALTVKGDNVQNDPKKYEDSIIEYIYENY